MGGASDKNRRKPRRQQEDKDSLAAERRPSQAKKFPHRAEKPNMAPGFGRPKQPPRGTTKSTAQNYHKALGNTEKKTKTKKFQKPKHLKRKLESAVDDADLQQKVLQDLQSFEALKSDKIAPTKTKKQKLDTQSIRHDDDRPQHSSNAPKEKVLLPRASTTIPKENRNHATTKPKDKNNSTGNTKDVGKPPKETNDPPLHSHDNKVNKVNHSFSATSSKNVSNSSDDDEDEEAEGDQSTQRTRGRRRRGRKKTSEQEQQQQQPSTAVPSVESSSEDATKNSKDQETASTQDKNERYCLGRKPVTDFVVGQSYPAKVVYMKPFGVFFDIGCHSDAFCHISRLSDDYVENPEQLFQLGDPVPAVRVVEVDRKTKRVTVSLQSLERINDEKTSLEARQRRKQESLSTKQRDRGSKAPTPSSQNNISTKLLDGTEANNDKDNKIIIIANKSATEAPAINKPESEMTPDELKRARKIARRAARRQQQPATQDGAHSE